MLRLSIVRALIASALTTVISGMLVFPGLPAFAVGYEITGATRTGADVHLHNLNFEMHYPETSVKSPQISRDIRPNDYRSWNVKSKGEISSLEVTLKWEIFDGADEPTGFWVNANFRRPWLGANTGTCSIFKENPDRGGVRTLESPYTCVWSNFDSRDWNPKPFLDVRAAEVVTDKDMARDILTHFCSEHRDDIGCVYTKTTFAEFLNKPVQVSDVYRNPNNFQVSKSMTWGHSSSESNSVSVSMAFDFKFSDIVKMKISASYGHSWSSTETKSDTVTLPVPSYSAGWFEYSSPMHSITGDWVINTGDRAWRLLDVTFTGPNSSGYGVLNACNGGLDDWVTNNTCLPHDPMATAPQL